jgi:hypothetical protein
MLAEGMCRLFMHIWDSPRKNIYFLAHIYIYVCARVCVACLRVRARACACVCDVNLPGCRHLSFMLDETGVVRLVSSFSNYYSIYIRYF